LPQSVAERLEDAASKDTGEIISVLGIPIALSLLAIPKGPAAYGLL
jgi:hypothetical protein